MDPAEAQRALTSQGLEHHNQAIQVMLHNIAAPSQSVHELQHTAHLVNPPVLAGSRR